MYVPSQSAFSVLRIQSNTRKSPSTYHQRLRPVRGYWRGPVWVDQVYFGITGLRNYGFDREADILTEKFINNAQGLTTDGPIHENYNPLTGEALNSPNFGWSSACIIKMLLDE